MPNINFDLGDENKVEKKEIPPFFAIPHQKGGKISWKLVNPKEEMEHFHRRKFVREKQQQRLGREIPELDLSIPRPVPLLTDFTKKDQAKLKKGMGKGISSETKASDAYSSGDDDDESGGNLRKMARKIVKKTSKFVKDVIHGRNDAYPPSVKKIVDANADAKVLEIELHRQVLPSVYTSILNVWTKGESEKRLKEEPKDKLFHISMWVKISNGKTILVEKNEVINMKLNPRMGKNEEKLLVPRPPNDLTFGKMLETTQKAIGDFKFFSYSAKDNNCGNFIENILKTNRMDSPQTHEFIGQDTKKILEGFPALRQALNTVTDLAAKGNVVLEGGNVKEEPIDWEHIKWGSFTEQFNEFQKQNQDNKIKDLEEFADMILQDPLKFKPKTVKRARFYLNVLNKQNKKNKKISHDTNIMPAQGGRRMGLSKPAILPAHTNHPALMSDQYPLIPQTHSQMYYRHPQGHGLWAGAAPMSGGNVWDDIGHKLNPRTNGVSHFFEKTLPSTLIHQTLPAVISDTTGALVGAATENPVAGFAASQTIGNYAGQKAGDALGKATGYGLNKPRHMVKGSKEAKDFMRALRMKRKMKGGEIPAPRSRNVITDPYMLG
jgi:hypothetical protein